MDMTCFFNRKSNQTK